MKDLIKNAGGYFAAAAGTVTELCEFNLIHVRKFINLMEVLSRKDPMRNQNIEGIHNYCDRWCERCTFTSRCAVYEDESGLSPEELDMTNKAFWQRIGDNFAKAQEFLQKAADEVGVDLSTSSPQMEEKVQHREKLKVESRRHPLALLSLEYSKIGRDWLKTQPGMLDRLDNLKTEIELGVESEEGARRETRTISDSIAVIQWYLVFIHIKFSRALMEKEIREERNDPDDTSAEYDGSAKVAIIAIDRSINAWSALFGILPEHEDHFLKVLSMLQKIRAIATEQFPAALDFIRPGLDAKD